VPIDSSAAQYLYLVEELGLWAIDHIGSHRPAKTSTKSGPADFLTEIDLAVEEHVREQIQTWFPDHRIIGEELGITGPEGGLAWYVDPVDGTTNYAHGLPWASFSLAVADAEGPVAGVVADPFRREMFSACRGQGARCNGVPIRCADAGSLAGGVLLTEWAGHRPWDGMTEMLATLSEQNCTTRIMGSSALSLAAMAAGRATATVLGGYATTDVLAGVLIAREAGARVLGRDGHDAPVLPGSGDGGLLAAGPGVAEAVWHAWRGQAG
jgi:fructose-1,6-bisphosphatase/inositol monophosphatase family enzyme